MPAPTAPTVTMPIRPSAAVALGILAEPADVGRVPDRHHRHPVLRAPARCAHSSANIVECWPNPRRASTSAATVPPRVEHGTGRGDEQALVGVAHVLRDPDDAVGVVTGEIRADQVAGRAPPPRRGPPPCAGRRRRRTRGGDRAGRARGASHRAWGRASVRENDGAVDHRTTPRQRDRASAPGSGAWRRVPRRHRVRSPRGRRLEDEARRRLPAERARLQPAVGHRSGGALTRDIGRRWDRSCDLAMATQAAPRSARRRRRV